MRRSSLPLGSLLVTQKIHDVYLLNISLLQHRRKSCPVLASMSSSLYEKLLGLFDSVAS